MSCVHQIAYMDFFRGPQTISGAESLESTGAAELIQIEQMDS